MLHVLHSLTQHSVLCVLLLLLLLLLQISDTVVVKPGGAAAENMCLQATKSWDKVSYVIEDQEVGRHMGRHKLRNQPMYVSGKASKLCRRGVPGSCHGIALMCSEQQHKAKVHPIVVAGLETCPASPSYVDCKSLRNIM